MSKRPIHWKPDLSYPTGKGATEQRFTAAVDGDELEIDTHPWGEADLKINDKPAGHIEGKASDGDAFREAESIAEDFENLKTKAALHPQTHEPISAKGTVPCNSLKTKPLTNSKLGTALS